MRDWNPFDEEPGLLDPAGTGADAHLRFADEHGDGAGWSHAAAFGGLGSRREPRHQRLETADAAVSGAPVGWTRRAQERIVPR